MRILQVVTLLSPDGRFGGPARVALNQSAELISRGHDVTVAAGAAGFEFLPSHLEGVPVQLFAARTVLPRTGFAGLAAPALNTWFRSNRDRFDAVHVHFGRDLVVLPVAAAAQRHRIPYILQTHGMVVPSRHPLAVPLDAVWTKKILRDAGTVFYLTELEREQLRAVAGTDLRLAPLGNGVPEYPATATCHELPEVLFAGRMHPRKRPIVFVEMAKLLLEAGVEAQFTLVGPDGGQGAALRESLNGDARIWWEGALPPAAIPQRIAAASVFVLPSVREPYPMSVLEAMAVGVPVVVSSDCGLAPLVERTRSGLVTDPELPALTAAVGTLLADGSLRRAMGKRARAIVRTDFCMRAVCDHLVNAYADLAKGAR